MSTTADELNTDNHADDSMLDSGIARTLLVFFAVLMFASVVLWGCTVHAGDDLDDWLRKQAAPDTRAEIWMETPTDWHCPRCIAAEKAFAGSKRFKLVPKPKAGLETAPVFRWSDRVGGVWRHVGFLDLPDFERRWDRTVNGRF